MVDLIDRAQDLEELQRQEALRRILDRPRPVPPRTPDPRDQKTEPEDA